MRSKIYASDVSTNRSRRFGEATIYYPAELIQPDGKRLPLMFTGSDLAQALERGKRNDEDIEVIRAEYLAWRAGVMRRWGMAAAIAVLLAGIILGVVL